MLVNYAVPVCLKTALTKQTVALLYEESYFILQLTSNIKYTKNLLARAIALFT